MRYPPRRPRTPFIKEKQMGRPLRKDVNGVDVLGTYATTNTGIRVSFYDGSTLQTDGVIIKQRGARTFVVCSVGSIGTTSAYFTCKLVNTTPNAAGEMAIIGYTTPTEQDANAVYISKLTRRVAYGFPTVPVLNSASSLWNAEDSNATTNHNAKKYTWYLSNDSSVDYLVLTEITAVL
jgi:hypothetical protein